MKIGILTFHFADNYGAVLQAYATQEFLKRKGHEVQVIEYAPKHMRDGYRLNPLIKSKRQIIPNTIVALKRYKQVELFKKFRKGNLVTSKALEKNMLREYTKEFDALLVGSDQVWNIGITQAEDVYFLNFVDDDVKGIGYAVSLGKNNDSFEFKQMVEDNIRKFMCVSFRERKAADFIEELTGQKYDDVTDPVLLLEKDEWNSVCKRPENFNVESYVLLYQLEENVGLQNLAIEIAKENNLEVYSIHPMCAKYDDRVKQINNVGPSEFLWLIQNAKFVCTNSFHGMAFSIIFRKKLISIAHETLGDRNRQLLNYFEMTDRESMVIDFSKEDYTQLTQKINYSKKWLENAVQSE